MLNCVKLYKRNNLVQGFLDKNNIEYIYIIIKSSPSLVLALFKAKKECILAPFIEMKQLALIAEAFAFNGCMTCKTYLHSFYLIY